MHLAIPFNENYPQFIHNNTEFNLHFRKQSNPQDLIDFAKQWPQRINVQFAPEVDTMKIIQEVKEVHPNIYLRLQADTPKVEVEKYIKEDIQCFYNEYSLVYSYPILDSLLSLGVSDVYLGDDLVYNYPRVSKKCHSCNVQVRAVLNMIPSTSVDAGNDYRDFLYTPQNSDIYSRYIDAAEFLCGYPYDFERLKVLERVYLEDKEWIGNLQTLIPQLNYPIHNGSLISGFINYKLNCGRACSNQTPVICRKCEQFITAADDFFEQDIRVIHNDDEGIEGSIKNEG